MKLVTRKEALAKGLKKYFTGKPCLHGHVAERYVHGHCSACHAAIAKAYTLKWNVSKQGRLWRRTWKKSAVGQASEQQYRTSEKGKAAHRRAVHSCYTNNIQFRLKRILRARLNGALKGKAKNGSAVKLLGCSVEELKRYLEKLFLSGMTWRNWAPDGWHVDHIKPLAKFDLTKLSQLRAACHYTNLQPLWAKDNHKKRDKYAS